MVWVLAVTAGFAQTSPHGEGFKANCLNCHTTSGWSVDLKTLAFDHATTRFPLTGQHRDVNCRQCHRTLEFANVASECSQCHTDVHGQTLGPDCGRCHTPASWIVSNVTEMHRRGRFPLAGAHQMADCFDCHTDASASRLHFGPRGTECIDCHRSNFVSARNPDHVAGKYSTSCTDCHDLNAFSWTGTGINHNFFPLTLGHAIDDCRKCHSGGSFSNTSPECVSCHLANYNATTNPGHAGLGFPTDCKLCHTTDPGWKPAQFRDHDSKSFPIYSGKHNGTWSSCSQCHPNPASYAQFTCTDCHEHNRTDMDDKHNGVQGYAYNSPDCFACHPTGTAEGTFNHATSAFPLTGAHLSAECIKCHTNGYAGTPTDCYACHQQAFNQSVNPNHTSLQLPTTCKDCHTTEPGWKPALFPIHNNYYILAGAHTLINNCGDCHKGNYSATPNTCAGCHQEKYNTTTNPPHAASQFPLTCGDCHTQTAWTPANWDHDGLYFPIYSGKHNGEWNGCTDCHTNPANYSVFTCTTACHPQSQTSNEHEGVTGYSYTSAACYNCHPQGNVPRMMNIIDRKE